MRILLVLLCSIFLALPSAISAMANTADSVLVEADQTLTSLLNDPRIRKKEVDSVIPLFEQTMEDAPWLLAILRTSSKGILVNEIGALKLYGKKFADVSTEEWFADAKDKEVARWQSVQSSAEKSLILCSRPFVVARDDGSMRLGGVVGFVIDPAELAKTFFGTRAHATALKGTVSGQAPASGSTIVSQCMPDFSVIVNAPAPVPPGASVAEVASVKNEPVSRDTPAHTVLKSSAGFGLGIERGLEPTPLAFAVALLITALLVFVVVRSVVSMTAHHSARVATVHPVDVFELPVDAPAPPRLSVITQPAKASKTDDEPVLPADSSPVNSSPVNSVPDPDAIRAELIKNEGETMAARIREELRRELYDGIISRERAVIEEQVRANISDYFKETLRDEIATEVRNLHGENIEQSAIAELTASIRSRVESQYYFDLEKAEYEALKDRVSREVREIREPEIRAAEIDHCSAIIRDEILTTHGEEIRTDVYDSLREEFRRELAEAEGESIRQHLRHELADGIARDVNAERPAMRAAALKLISERIKEELVVEEMEPMRERLLAELREKIRAEVASEFHLRFMMEERETLRATVRASVIDQEYQEIIAFEREGLHEQIRAELLERERMLIEESERNALRNGIREELRSEELEDLSAQARESLTEEIRALVDQTERVVIEESVVQEVRAIIRERILREDYARIHDEARVIVEAEIREQVVRNESQSIREHERARVATEEAQLTRTAMERAVQETVISGIYKKVREEIYVETMSTFRAAFRDRYRRRYEEALRRAVARASQRANEKALGAASAELSGIMSALIELERNLAIAIPVDSLRETVEKLDSEKQRYRFFNLNASQTEGLIGYLGRLLDSLKTASSTVDDGMRSLRTSIFTASQKLVSASVNPKSVGDTHDENTDRAGAGLPPL